MIPELKQAITLIKAGQKQEGKELLLQILNEDEHNDVAWVWLSATVDTDEMRLECLEEALKINPDNETAQRGYQKITRRMQKKQEQSLEASWENLPQAEPPVAQAQPSASDTWSHEDEFSVAGKQETADVNIQPTYQNPLTSSPWLTIWYAPRLTVTAILQSKNPQQDVLLIAAIIGVLSGIAGALPMAELGAAFFIIILIIAIVIGPIVLIIGVYISAAILSWIGFFFNGQGSTSDVRTAITWAYVPQIPVSILAIIQIIMLSSTTFITDPITGIPQIPPGVGTLYCVQSLFGLYAFYIFLQCLGAAHRFSFWRALGTFFMPSVVILLFSCGLFFLLAITS